MSAPRDSMIGDLHCHTRLSDSSISVDDLIFYAKRAGLDFIAITDHDTMDGVTRASVLGKRYGVNVIPGVELSSYDFSRGRKVHMLCYLPDKPDRLQGLCNHVLEQRTRTGKKMIRAVMQYYPVTEEHILRYTSGSRSIYRVHIMQALLDLGYDNQVYGALYRRLFDPWEGLCIREFEYPDVREVLGAIHGAGGIAVMAHPTVYDSVELLEELAEEELLHGVETYHPRMSEEDRRMLEGLAARYDLIKTGGSDFHGFYSSKPSPLATCVTSAESINAMYTFKRAAKAHS